MPSNILKRGSVVWFSDLRLLFLFLVVVAAVVVVVVAAAVVVVVVAAVVEAVLLVTCIFLSGWPFPIFLSMDSVIDAP